MKMNLNVRVISVSLLIPLLLAGCSSSQTVVEGSEQVQLLNAPTTCELPDVVNTFNDSIAGSKYVPTDWQPSPGTDLAAAIDAGGIACTYGIQVAEVGGTIIWAPNKDGLWDQRSALWSASDYEKFDIAGINEDDAYVLRDDVTGADGAQIWQINLLISGVWIQLGASFIQTMEEATPFIQASINALRK
jgi:outer membrane murein-binding lipoprotein Lpp